jgi:hypothetical protein
MKKMKYEELTMKVDYLEPELAPISILPRDFSIGLAALLKGVLTRDHVHEDKLSYWQQVFLQSKSNGCLYRGEDLPQINWAWPKKTWFQEKLGRHLKGPEFAPTRRQLPS